MTTRQSSTLPASSALSAGMCGCSCECSGRHRRDICEGFLFPLCQPRKRQPGGHVSGSERPPRWMWCAIDCHTGPPQREVDEKSTAEIWKRTGPRSECGCSSRAWTSPRSTHSTAAAPSVYNAVTASTRGSSVRVISRHSYQSGTSRWYRSDSVPAALPPFASTPFFSLLFSLSALPPCPSRRLQPRSFAPERRSGFKWTIG